jgi:hypothetical protein
MGNLYCTNCPLNDHNAFLLMHDLQTEERYKYYEYPPFSHRIFLFYYALHVNVTWDRSPAYIYQLN